MKKQLLRFMFLLCALIVGSSVWAADETLTVDFENAANTYTDWVFDKMVSAQTNSNVTAHGGSYFGTTGGKETASITTKEKIASPKSIHFFVSKQSTNTTPSSWYVRVSTDGNEWTQVGDGQSASSMSRGSWVEVTWNLSAYSDVYVRIFYAGSTAIRCIDDVTLTYEAAASSPLSSIAITTPPTKTTYYEGEIFDKTGMVVTATYEDESTKDVTAQCTFSPSTALTTGDNEITVSYTENAVEKTTTQAITVNALPKYTVTFGDEGSVTQETPGAEVILPSRSEKAGYSFAGWSTTNVASETTEAPSIIPAGSYTPTANITLYPVYTKTEGGSAPSAFSVGDTGNFAIVAEISAGEYYALPTNPTVNNGKITAQEITVSELDDVKYVTPANASGFTWTIATATNGYTLSDGSHYIYHSNGGSSGTNLAYGDLTTYTWAFTADGSYIKMAGMSGSTTNSRGLLFSDKTIGGYALSNWGSYNKTMILPVANAGTTYYWSAPVAATVARPTIEVEANPFMFSTTATITCETEGAAIKYSFDGKNWNDYTEELTITEATTLYAKAVKDENESTVASVEITKNLATPTVAIDATGITNTNVFDGKEAGSLAATVTYNEEAVEGAVVTWSGNNDEVATIDAETGAVTLVAAGTVTFTATYAGNSDYAEKTATYEMTVTNTDPNAPGTENNPYTVADIIDFIETLGEGTSAEVFVKGIISQIDSYNSKFGSITYWISDDGTTTTQFECYSGLGLNSAKFSSIDDLQLGDEVVVAGTAKKYGDVYEFNYNNYIVSLVRKVATPTFDPAAGEVMAGTTVTISTTTEDATIYYTVDGTEPTTESEVYTEAITINEDMTIKAIAVKNGMTNSDVATASYSIIVTPTITISTSSIEADAAGTDDLVSLEYANLTIGSENDFAVQYYDSEGEETDKPDWMDVEVMEDNGYVVFYTIGENTSAEARTAYFKVYAMDDNTNLVYSNLVTVTQAGYVAPAVNEQFELFTGELVEGDYVIYYNGFAMNTSVDNGRLQYAEVTPEDDVITTDNAAIVWHIAKSGDYWTIYNAEADAYAASTGVKNKAQMLADGTDDMALWKISGDGEYEFVNKKNSEEEVNAYLRNNGTYGFACYAVGTGGDLLLYKKVIPVTGEATITLSANCTDGEKVYGTYSNASAFVVPSDLTVSEIAVIDGKLLVETYSTGTVVPANTGVMVAAAQGGEYTVNLTSDAGTSVLGAANCLRATGEGITADEMAAADENCVFYRLTMHNGTDLGFYWGAAEGAAFEVAANKAYMAVPKAAGSRIQGFNLDGGTTTGISDASRLTNNGEMRNDNFFNLNGQRLRVGQLRKGLYIKGGKKVVVR